MKTSEEPFGKAKIKIASLAAGFRGSVILDGKQIALLEDEDQDRLRARLRNEAGRLHPDYVGYGGAIARFLGFFDRGFDDPAYVELERSYKLASQRKLLDALSLEVALEADAEQAIKVRKAFNTNVLSSFELARTYAMLGGETGPAYVRGAATFALGDLDAGIAAMTRAIAPHGRASWPMLTYLPNLWSPEAHIFLKPEKTKEFAQRVGHGFANDYSASLEAGVYRSLLDMVVETEVEIAKLKPRDRIDVQSFIWVVGDYKEAQHEEVAQARRKLDRASAEKS